MLVRLETANAGSTKAFCPLTIKTAPLTGAPVRSQTTTLSFVGTIDGVAEPACGNRGNRGNRAAPAGRVRWRRAMMAPLQSRALTIKHIPASLGTGPTGHPLCTKELQPALLTDCSGTAFNLSKLSHGQSAHFGCSPARETAMLRPMIQLVPACVRAGSAQLPAPDTGSQIPLACARAVALKDRPQLEIHPRSAPEQITGRRPNIDAPLRTSSMTPDSRPLVHLRPRGRTCHTSPMQSTPQLAPGVVARSAEPNIMIVLSRGN